MVRLNVDDRAGAEARAQFQVQKVPTIIVLDADGVERYHTEGKLPRRRAIMDALA